MKGKEISFCGLTFKGLSKEAILNSPGFQQIVTVGAEFIIEAQKNNKLRDIINNNVSTFDGQVPFFFAKHKHPQVHIDKISGADFIYDICERAASERQRIFLLGGYPDSNKGSVERMKNMGIEAKGFVTGFIPYPFPQDRLDEIKQLVKEFKPTYLFVGLGMGKQEYFISDNRKFLEECGVRIAIGSGGTFEVFSGKVKRAPLWMQKIGLEGLYRVISDPSLKRLKRFVSTLKFLKYINK